MLNEIYVALLNLSSQARGIAKHFIELDGVHARNLDNWMAQLKADFERVDGLYTLWLGADIPSSEGVENEV